MATIQTLNASDDGATSLAAINTNFTAVNSALVEPTSTTTLTNKTIDADSNTITNLDTTTVKATAKSGLDTAFITGTAGTDGNLTKFNGDGDVIDAGVTISTDTTLGGASPLNSNVPTQAAVQSYVQTTVVGHKFFPITYEYTTQQTTSDFYNDYVFNNSGDDVNISFAVPTTFSAVTSAYLVGRVISTASSTMDFTATSRYGNPLSTESSSQHSSTVTQQVVSPAVDGQFFTIDVSSIFGNLAAGDFGSVTVDGTLVSGSLSQFSIIGMVMEF